MRSPDTRRPGDRSLEELLRSAAEAPAGLASGSPARIEFRDPIAAFGTLAVRKLEAWLSDPRLAVFAVLTIERAAAQPDVLELAGTALRRARIDSPDSLRDLIDQALEQLQPRRAVARPRSTSPSAQDSTGSPELATAELRRVISEWRRSGSPSQPGIDWPRPAWVSKLPKHRELLRDLPDCIDRAEVRAVSVHAADDAEAAERALVAVMVWGHGRRTLRALIHDSNVSKWLMKYAGSGLGSQAYSERTYGNYLRQMHEWARALGCTPDDVELCIFRAGVPSKSQWADGCA